MFNQEQLAAIAAAMSYLQQSMQSNPTNHNNGTSNNATTITTTTPPTSLATTAHSNNSNSNNPNTSLTNNCNNDNTNPIAAVQQHLNAVAAAAAAASHSATLHHHHHQHLQSQQQQQQQQNQSQLVGNANIGYQQSQLAAGLASLASLEAALPSANNHLLQHLSARHVSSPSVPNTNSDTSQHALVNQYRSQFDRPDLNLSPSPPKQVASPANIRLDEHQQQMLLNQLRAIQHLQQQHHQQDLHHLTNSPPKLLQQQSHQQLHHHQQQHQQQQQQQQQQQHQALINQFKMQQQTDVHIMAPSSPQRPQPLAPLTQQQAPQQLNQNQNSQQQQQPDLKHQTSAQVKVNRPISYSAIVAKSAGLASNNNNNNNTNNNSSISNVTNHTTNNSTLVSYANSINDNATNNISSMASHNHNKTANLATTNNTYGGLNHSSGLNNSASAFSATNNQNSVNETDPMNKFSNFNGAGSINGHSLRPQLSASNSIVKNSLNNHIANHSTNDDIFNTNNLASSLGHTNGSSLLKHHNNLLSLETTLDNYATDHPTSPAHQLFNQHNHSFRQNQMPTNLIHQQLHQHQNNRSNNNEIILSSPNSRDKNTTLHGRATNLLGFMGLYVGNLSPDLTKEQLEKIFSKYGEPVKAHRLIRSPVAFIKYENTESPRAAIDDLYGLLLPELTLNQDQPLKLHFDRNDVQLKANYRPTELPREDNGECYGWRTTVCRRGKNCPKKHIPINRGIDFQMWMIKSNLTGVTGGTAS